MLLLHRYLLRQFVTALVFTCSAVMIVALFTQAFRLLSLVVDNAAGLWVFLQLTLLLIPTLLGVVLPIGLAVAIVFVYHKLATDSELMIMRSAGMSNMQLARPALWLGGIALFMALLLTLWIAPWANRTLVAMQYQIRNEFSIYLLRPGMFNDIGKGLTFYARQRDRLGGMENILIHDNRQPEAPVTVMAERGQMMMVENEPRIVVFNGQRQEFDRVKNSMTTLDFKSYSFDMTLLQGVNDRLPDPRELSLADLLADNPIMTKRGGATRLRAELHQRVGGSLAGLGFSTLAATLMLGGQFSRRGMVERVLLAAISLLLLQAGLMWLSNLVVRDLQFVPLFYGLALLPLPLSWWLTRRGFSPHITRDK